MFGMLDPSAIVSIAPRLLPMLSPDWETGPQVDANGVDSSVNQSSFVRQTCLKLSLTLFILVGSECTQSRSLTSYVTEPTEVVQ
jgi:hypothetical protein